MHTNLAPIDVTVPRGRPAPLMAAIATWPDRFLAKVAITDDCWEWQAYRDRRTGYGRFKLDRRGPLWAHRLALELVGVMIDGLVVDHLYRNHA